MAYGEFKRGVVSNERDVLFVNIDFGFGMGILIGDLTCYAKSGFSGEFGQIPFFQNERICHCGKRGCLGTETLDLALLEAVKARIKLGSSSVLSVRHTDVHQLRLEEIIKAARQEDSLVAKLLSDIGDKLRKSIAMLINIFNPELVIFGGKVFETGDFTWLPIRNALNKFALGLANNDTQLQLSLLGARARVMGDCLIARGQVIFGCN